jgi:hypothetical protein
MDFQFELKLLYPVLMITAISILAAVFDKISEGWHGPAMDDGQEKHKNTALFLTLPLLAVGPLFFLHSAAGYLFLVIFFIYFTIQSLSLISLFQRITVVRAWVIWLFSSLLLFAPVILLLTLMNLFLTFQIFRMY